MQSVAATIVWGGDGGLKQKYFGFLNTYYGYYIIYVFCAKYNNRETHNIWKRSIYTFPIFHHLIIDRSLVERAAHFNERDQCAINPFLDKYDSND